MKLFKTPQEREDARIASDCARGNHVYRTVAFDPSFEFVSDRLDDQGNKVTTAYCHVGWLSCRHCNHRSFDRGYEHSKYRKHASIEQVRLQWLENNEVQLTRPRGTLYDRVNYSLTNQSQDWEVYSYKSLTVVEQHIARLEQNHEFQEMCKNQMISDAFDQLQLVIKLHSKP
jgi:hypothetical protein